MSRKITRRGVLLGGAKVAAAAGLTTVWPGSRDAFAKESLTIVEWGGAYVEGMKQLVERQGKYDVTWELHAGGSAAILPKIKAAWPDRLLYDMVAGWEVVYLGMIREGWVEPITVEDVPNLVDVPDSLLTKDKDGTIYAVPRNMAVNYFGYREDVCPIEIKSVEDFLSPELKNQIAWPEPVYGSNIQTVNLALARGGDEYNMEPGWQFLKEIAKSGNIGRIIKTETDQINSLSTGETSISYAPAATLVRLAEHGLPIRHLHKETGAGLKAMLVTEGWAVMKGKNTKAAFDFLNYTISREAQEWWSKHLGAPPVNVHAKAPEKIAFQQYSQEEIEKHGYLPDWDYVSQQLDGWVKRFEQEIVPLL